MAFLIIFSTVSLFFSIILENIVLAEDKVKIFPDKENIAFDLGNVTGRLQLKYKPESFFGDRIHRLNRNFDSDRIFLSRHTLDTNFGLQYGEQFYDHVAAEFFASFRIKTIWGNPGSVLTSEETIRYLDTVQGNHSHFVRLEVPRFREIWFSFNINDALNTGFENQHYFKLGTFPFELGRGISLGSAYAVNQGFLGFYSDNTIDQYAPGYRFSGDIVKDELMYDVYGAILENLSDSFKDTTAKVRGQEYGRRLTPQRGFGQVDYIIAGRLRWIPYDDNDKHISFEPYLLYNHAPEQKIDFVADAATNLGTFGLAAEFRKGNFEFGFDTAFNRGGQKVRGWDRNVIALQNKVDPVNFPRIVQINTRVIAEEVVSFGDKPLSSSPAVFVQNSQAQRAIWSSAQDESQNGQLIGTKTFILDDKNVQLRNDRNRFRDPYTNNFGGWMFIADAAYTFYDGDCKLAVMWGAASGDEDPNVDLGDPNFSNPDRQHDGFIGLQEIYSGDRVKSVFLLGGAGRAPRPLTTPSHDTALDRLPTVISNFTNLILVGGSFVWEPQDWGRDVRVMPNILSYWKETPIKAFDVRLNESSPLQLARRHLGVELNIFVDVEMFPGIKLYTADSVFIPGAFYKDIKGKPLLADELVIIDIDDVTGVDFDRLPLLSDNISYTLNFGIEMKF